MTNLREIAKWDLQQIISRFTAIIGLILLSEPFIEFMKGKFTNVGEIVIGIILLSIGGYLILKNGGNFPQWQ